MEQWSLHSPISTKQKQLNAKLWLVPLYIVILEEFYKNYSKCEASTLFSWACLFLYTCPEHPPLNSHTSHLLAQSHTPHLQVHVSCKAPFAMLNSLQLRFLWRAISNLHICLNSVWFCFPSHLFSLFLTKKIKRSSLLFLPQTLCACLSYTSLQKSFSCWCVAKTH